uniref:Uncharacterized protein n=1 Tax=Physcomitrium patens TaxID=3218 RepID=A0A2K1IJ21_PHYPA|nr:hypothetical protein PHYPA_027973 [Physcomitrium patens]
MLKNLLSDIFFYLNSSLLNWHSKKQPMVAQSSTKAKYNVTIFKEIGHQVSLSSIICYDNQSYIVMT